MLVRWFPAVAIVVTLLLPACRAPTPAVPPPDGGQPADTATEKLANKHPLTARSARGRLVAIGDLHGDLQAARQALRLAGAADANDHWSGGDLVVVQTGDVLDRGDDERAILDWFEQLQRQAEAAGGALIMLDANHEVMAVDGKLSGTTEGAMASFVGVEDPSRHAAALAGQPDAARHRIAALQPGAPYALILAGNDIIAQVGDTLFVHGGVIPAHVEYGLQRYNDEAHAWMLGAGPAPAWRNDRDSPIWSRLYSDDPDSADCAALDQVLVATGTRRMVMGHTVQKDGISSACDDHAWRIDVGLSTAYDSGMIQVLEIRGAEVRALTAQRE